ncbi:MAG TPA: putative zinc-binding metallopeptidase [Saprospiraceae bacterium]|nr:putative zinc-binding metallopeptidase [Saprospiraceae bacterium]HPN70100.1 putative zinc-binding metallopeptidase [Saprospiraceae bacterium]
MKVFKCQNCAHPVYFENTKCLQCGSSLGFEYQSSHLVALILTANGLEEYGVPGKVVKYCANHEYDVCNWLIHAEDARNLCEACTLNQKIPNLQNTNNIEAWRRTENAKHRLIYSLNKLNLPILSKSLSPNNGLAFEFLADQDHPMVADKEKTVKTGHENGKITLNIAEADVVYREKTRALLKEDYRTLIGHFRHEIGHYYWDQLVWNDYKTLEMYRNLFGDERADYTSALNRYYAFGPAANWNFSHISAYASSHPWEDWAESWAHYMHFVDTLESAYSFGISLQPRLNSVVSVSTNIDFDPYEEKDFNRIIDAYLPLTFAVNSINRSMGIQDLYPFVTHNAVLDKMKFIHNLIHGQL